MSAWDDATDGNAAYPHERRDAHQQFLNAQRAEFDRDEAAELAKVRGHSVILNRIGYATAVLLGKADGSKDYYGDTEADFGELLALHQRTTSQIVEMYQLIRDLMIDTDLGAHDAEYGECYWCGASGISMGGPHKPDCAWLRAKTLTDKADTP